VSIELAESDTQILNCFPVLFQLRPHLNQADFLNQVKHQSQFGYQLAFLQVNHRAVAIAGFRLSHCLAYGKFLYVDDLVVDEAVRSQGYGQQIFQWLIDYARNHACEQLHLDSGVQRFRAHRFYFQQGMSITSHHFAIKL
jgi:GNAT superfamily N-acetyltransferase